MCHAPHAEHYRPLKVLDFIVYVDVHDGTDADNEVEDEARYVAALVRSTWNDQHEDYQTDFQQGQVGVEDARLVYHRWELVVLLDESTE